jgi:3-deoxy-D-manno-octulosonate 8-phosphate phosphatase (KDO 8-P phosphatase)
MKKPNIKKLFKNIKLLILDVDGVLTRGEIIYDSDGRELKRFNVKDGLGVSLLAQVGINSIIVTAKESPVVHFRAKDMRVAEVIAGILPKEKNLAYITEKYKILAKDICFVGDDLLDLGLMAQVGLAVTVNDAPQIVKKAAKYITSRNGGQAAVREIVDCIVQAQGLEKKILDIVINSR